jgi:hypothetical protein
MDHPLLRVVGPPLAVIETGIFKKISSIRLIYLACTLPIIESLYLILSRSSFYTYMNGIPVTDSKGWFGCIKSLAYTNSWPVESEDWCLRRPLYPLIASRVFRVVPNLDLFFISFSLIYSLTLYFTVKQVRKIGGDLSAWVAIFGAASLWFVYGATQTLSEQVGLILGTLGIAFFFKYLVNFEMKSLYFGTYFFCIAQSARPGNVFSYLFPILLILLIEQRKIIGILRLSLFCYLPLILSVFAIRRIFSIPNFMHSGNSWATIYGLQFDNQPWTASYEALPKGITGETQIWDYIKKVTLSDVKENPFNIPISILKNSMNVVNFGPLNLVSSSLILLVFVLSLVYVYKKAILPVNLIVIVVVVPITELLTYGISYFSEPIRTMSTTLIFSAVLLSLPISSILRYMWLSSRTTVGHSIASSPTHTQRSKIALIFFALSLLFVYPVGTPSSPNLFLMAKHADRCAFEITINDYPSKYIQQQDLNKIEGKYGEWWSPLISQLNQGSFVLITSVDSLGNSHDSSVYLENTPVGALKRGDIICISRLDEENQTLSSLGFNHAFILK